MKDGNILLDADSTLHVKKLRHRHDMPEVTLATQATPNFKRQEALRCNATLGF